MFNFQGISTVLLIGVISGLLIGWLFSKEYYMDAETELFVRALKKLPPKQRSTIKHFVLSHYAS